MEDGACVVACTCENQFVVTMADKISDPWYYGTGGEDEDTDAWYYDTKEGAWLIGTDSPEFGWDDNVVDGESWEDNWRNPDGARYYGWKSESFVDRYYEASFKLRWVKVSDRKHREWVPDLFGFTVFGAPTDNSWISENSIGTECCQLGIDCNTPESNCNSPFSNYNYSAFRNFGLAPKFGNL